MFKGYLEDMDHFLDIEKSLGPVLMHAAELSRWMHNGIHGTGQTQTLISNNWKNNTECIPINFPNITFVIFLESVINSVSWCDSALK